MGCVPDLNRTARLQWDVSLTSAELPGCNGMSLTLYVDASTSLRPNTGFHIDQVAKCEWTLPDLWPAQQSRPTPHQLLPCQSWFHCDKAAFYCNTFHRLHTLAVHPASRPLCTFVVWTSAVHCSHTALICTKVIISWIHERQDGQTHDKTVTFKGKAITITPHKSLSGQLPKGKHLLFKQTAILPSLCAELFSRYPRYSNLYTTSQLLLCSYLSPLDPKACTVLPSVECLPTCTLPGLKS